MKPINELLIDTRAALSARLSSTPINQHAYLLIDNSALDGAWLQAQPDVAVPTAGPIVRLLASHSVMWQGLIGDMTRPAHSAAAPLLVQLNKKSLHQSFLDQVSQKALLQNALHFLTSPETLLVLAARLQKRLRVKVGTQEMVLRYFDSRFLHDWLALLPVEQQAGFLSVADNWIYLNRDGEMTTLTTQFSSNETMTFPFNTDTHQRAGLRRMGLSDRVQNAWEALNQEPLLPDLAPTERHRWLHARIDDANQYDINTPESLATYCTIALSEGDSFHEQPVWRNKLAPLKSNSTKSGPPA